MHSAERMFHASHVVGLSNHDLIARLKSWAVKERRVTLGVLLLLNEVERRTLHLDQYSSLFAYCTDRLGYSNSAAGRRIAAARCLRSYPAVVPMLLDGRLNLTTLCILARVLTEENAADLLARGAGASQEAAELLAAEFGAPKPARDRIKPIKSPQGGQLRDTRCDGEGSDDHSASAGQSKSSSFAQRSEEQRGATGSTRYDTNHGKSQGDDSGGDSPADGSPAGGSSTGAGTAGSPRARCTESAMYDVRFRADGELVEKLRRAQALLSSAQSNPSLALVVDRALEALLDRHDPVRREARRQTRQAIRKQSDTSKNPEARTDQPRTGAERASELRAQEELSDASNVGPVQEPSRARRRSISRQVRDQVLLLFGMQCAFVGPEGRCPVTRNLDLDHVVPIAVGGSDDPTNLRPVCRAHNQRAADRVFGTEFMNRKRSRVAAPRVGRANGTQGAPAPGVSRASSGPGTPAPGVSHANITPGTVAPRVPHGGERLVSR